MEMGYDECFWNNGGGILFTDPETGFLKRHFRNYEPVQEPAYSTDAYGREAAAFIERHAGGERRFFFFLSFVPPHWPMEAKPEHLEQFAHVRDLHRRTMLAMMGVAGREHRESPNETPREGRRGEHADIFPQ
jgi:hypothetical protein